MHFVIVSQYYPPEVGAPQARLSGLAARFVAAGHRVTVLTAMPNYPAGRIHAGYGGILRREQRGGVSIIRTYVYPTQRAAMIPRLANYCSFVLSSSLLGPFLVGSADYLLVESPPLFLGPAGWWLSLWARARLIFNVSDLWPDSAVQLDVLRRDSVAFGIAQRIEAFCYRRAWLVTGASKSIIANIKARFSDRRTFLLSNGVDTNTFGPDHKSATLHDSLAAGRRTLILYAGLHGLAQGLGQILDAAEALASDGELQFVLVGDGPEKSALMADAGRRGLGNVCFLDSRPFSDVPALLASADIIVVSLKMEIPGAVPSKLYEAMASGRPVILVASGEAADVVRKFDAGVVVSPGDIQGLAEAIRQLSQDSERAARLGKSGREAAQLHFERAVIARNFIEHLEQELPAS